MYKSQECVESVKEARLNEPPEGNNDRNKAPKYPDGVHIDAVKGKGHEESYKIVMGKVNRDLWIKVNDIPSW